MSRPRPHSPALIEAARALQGHELERAERLVRSRLAEQPQDPEALRLLAGIAAAARRPADAERSLRQAIECAPGFAQAYADLCALLCKQGRCDEALALLDDVRARQPDNVWALSLKGAVLETESRTNEALHVHELLVARASHAAIPWLNYGHALKTVGRVAEAVAAYRRSLELNPASGHAWWGLANLRTAPLGAEDVALMEQALLHVGDDLNRVQIHFALGRAWGGLGRFELSFRHYVQANEIRGRLVPYDAEATSTLVREVEAAFTPDLVARRAGEGCDAPDPIFIVGMPRSGSTLMEQILASHPRVEGLGELPDLREIAAQIGGADASQAGWPEALLKLGADELRAMGESYLASTRRRRRTDRPFFTDKMPANWQYVGLIQLILPKAKIIDMRRRPLACCLSVFATYFNRETSVPASLTDLGRYYRDYVRMIDHFDAVTPGRIYHARHERVVEDLEGEVRRVLAHLGLPFDPACLRFHENPRPVHTPSAQQVRKPVNRDGLDRWRDYEPWLAPLKNEVGMIDELYS